MSEISTRTIVINGDDGWPFRDLLWCHGLDLYPLDTGVDIFDVVPLPGDDGGPSARNYQTVIGNFPEDYSNEPDTLLEEIDETVAGLADAENRDKYLSIALVINRADFEALATAKDADDPAVSQGAMSGYLALRRAMQAVENQGDRDDPTNVIGRISTRVWFSLIVRDAGADKADERNGEKVMAFMKQNRMGLGHIFFLSESRAREASDKTLDRQFAKLRVLIDILRQFHTDAVQKNMTTESLRGFGADTSKLVWVRSNDSEATLLAKADLLRRGLVFRIAAMDRENKKKNSTWREEFESLKKEFNALLPGLQTDQQAADDASEAYNEVTALNAVVTAAKNANAANRDVTDQNLDADEQISRCISTLANSKRTLFYSANAARNIETSAAEYNAALSHARDMYGHSLSAEIDRLRADLEHKRIELHAVMDRITLPSDNEALQTVNTYCANVLDVGCAAAASEIKEARAVVAKQDALNETIWASMASSRATAVARLLDTENRLLRWRSTMLVIGIVSFVALLPILLVPIIRSIAGSGAIVPFGNMLGPMGVILGFSVIISLAFAVVLALRLRARRNAALDLVTDAMDRHYKELRLCFASLLRIAVNRWRLSLLNTTQQFLRPAFRPGDESPERFANKLAIGQARLSAASYEVSPKTDQALDQAFNQKSDLSDKITSLLVADLPLESAHPLLIEPGHFGGTEFTLASTSSLAPISVKLGVVGDE